MYKKVFSIALLTLILFGLFAIPNAKAVTTATYYVEATKTTGLDIDEEFWVIVKFKDFTQLWMWQTGLLWDKSVLTCEELVEFKPFYPESVFAVLAPTRSTAFIDGTIDNAAGKIYPPGAESLKAPGEGVTGTPGTGYPVLKAKFKVTGFFPSGTDLTPIETLWTAYPDYGTTLPHTVQSLTIYSVVPPAPHGPEAKFSWTPVFPKQGETITFDASASKSGFDGTSNKPITEYRWDWDNDGIFDTNVPGPITTHVFATAGDYPVTLEVYAPGATPETNSITKTVKVLPPSLGAAVDLYCNKVPFDGKGSNVQSDAFAPQELVILYAKVTYNEDPVANKIVGFQVNSSDGQAILYRTAITNDEGVASVEFRIPSNPPFGLWMAWAIVDVAQTTVADTMPFEVGWIVEILSVVPGDTSYKKGTTADFTITIKNISNMSKIVTLTIVIYDDVAVPIAIDKVVGWPIDALEPGALWYVELNIPLWAFKGTGTVYVNSFTALPSNNGVPTCPEKSASFLIESP